jgi:HEAT repeat protein
MARAPRSWALPPLRPTIDAALRDVGSTDPKYRAMAAEALGGAPEDRAAEAALGLSTLIRDEDAEVRWNAAQALGLLGGPEAAAALVRAADDADRSVRIRVLDALCRLEHAGAEPIAARASEDPDVAVREASASALVRLAGARALPRLTVLATDPQAPVRAAAAAALGEFPQEARETIAALLGDPDPVVRVEAAFSLAPVGDRRATSVLVSLLSSRADRRDAAGALGRLGDPAAVEPLRRLVARFFLDRWTRVTATAALARLGDPGGARALVAILQTRRWDAVALAAEEAAALGLGEAIPALRRLAEHPPPALGSAPFERALAALRGEPPSPEAA